MTTPVFDRRSVLARATGLLVLSGLPALAQVPPAKPTPPLQPPARFGFEDVVKRAKELAASPFDGRLPELPEPLQRLDFDAWRAIRFRPDRALLAQGDSPFRMQMFHPGFLHKRTVIVNVVRDGIPAPVPFATNLFDYGPTKLDKALPVNLGFAGFRLHYPLNSPLVFDELISFLGTSYFRFLGRGQKYGLSARGLAIGIGAKETEEFPFFREFWVEQPGANAERVVIYALLDGESATGAYQFNVYPGNETTVDITAQLVIRKPIAKLGIAPLSSMFFYGEVEPGRHEDYRPELHDSDGLQIHSGTGERIWRPLRNPREAETSVFIDKDPRGFGLMQRDRNFEHYQDLDLHYEARPSYWVEPHSGWGDGRIELLEIPTSDETNDNIVASWVPKTPVEAGQMPSFRYSLRAMLAADRLTPGGCAINTFRTSARALGSNESPASGTTRFLIDFAGGDLAYYLPAPHEVEVVPTVTNGTVKRTFVMPNPQTRGFRAGIDIQLDSGQSTDLRAFLRTGQRALTETWTLPWKAQ